MGVIPARYGSTRLPAKALALIHGKPMIQHVYERCLKAKLLSEVLVATDDRRIFDAVINFGGNAAMTSKSHTSGTDRIGEAVRNIKCDIVVNIQGDEPMIAPGNIDKAIKPLISDKSINVSSLCYKISHYKEINNPNVVKVVMDSNSNALYFSRSVIPFNRDNSSTDHNKHIGLYVYRKDYLMKLIKMKPSRLELTEKLEQLRILESGENIRIIKTNTDSHSVDTLNDLKKIRRLIKL
ncbi:MAG TPA: 3-deoxy-manno-octulosonate cytidylyltransferase [Ignavibacteria bacterium]|nr:3-deoxy-manno-octulosonate cytidylyltransferase [Ignavibacteria bacterium]HMQ98906.1 3-deoxy-manno-octulosonate cytidylyltransferase [Ignavibacteria bacterium]